MRSTFLFMIKGESMQVISTLKNESLLNRIITASKSYSNLCNKDFLYVCLDKKDISNTFVFTVRYEESSFMHLCGIKSKTMDASSFYRNCLNSSITLNDCTPAYDHSVQDISSKVSILSDLLDVKNMKMFKADDPNIQPQKAEFDIGIGNDTGFIGYRYDKYIKKLLPVTNMPQPLTKYCFDPQKISMVMSKKPDEKLFSKTEFEISKDLLSKLDVEYYYLLLSFVDDLVLEDAFKEKLFEPSKEQEYEMER